MGLKLGIDIGSTTVKVVIMDGDAILWRRYERHFSQVRQKTAELLESRPPGGGRPASSRGSVRLCGVWGGKTDWNAVYPGGVCHRTGHPLLRYRCGCGH